MKNRGSFWRLLSLAPIALVTMSALGGVALFGVEASPGEVADAARAFLSTLDAEARAQATYEIGDEERLNWHFIPRERNGLPLKAMSSAQRNAAHRLLKATLSTQGYLKANAVMELERILGVIEGREERRDPEDYYFTIFGSPSTSDAWAWRFEGHHVSLNFASITNQLVVTGPAFFGANPATVLSGPKAGLRMLGNEEDLGRSLARMLSDTQRRTAVIAREAPDDIITGADREAALDRFEGIAASAMTSAQRDLMFRLIGEYVHNMDQQSADRWMERIENTRPDQIHFAWAGGLEPGQGHYYRVHAPDFLIEYDNTQNDANHVHSVWRDLRNDFGGDVLLQHYQESHHQN